MKIFNACVFLTSGVKDKKQHSSMNRIMMKQVEIKTNFIVQQRTLFHFRRLRTHVNFPGSSGVPQPHQDQVSTHLKPAPYRNDF